jgi:PAS domain-containing protein
MQKRGIKIEFAVTDEIVALQKNVSQFLDKANKSELKIRKLAESLKAEYKFYAGNLQFAKNQTKVAQSIGAKFEKMAKDLGVPVAGTEPAKNLNVVFSDGVEFETDLGIFQPIIGRSILNQYGQNYVEYIRESLLAAFEGVSEQFELKFQEKTFSLVVTPLPEKTGKINLVMKIAQNVSLQKNAQLEAHYSREYLRQVIDVDPNFIYVKNKEGAVIMANKSVSNFFGSTVQDFIKNSTEYFKTYKWRYEEILKIDEEIFKTLKTKTSEEAIFNKETKIELSKRDNPPISTEGVSTLKFILLSNIEKIDFGFIILINN